MVKAFISYSWDSDSHCDWVKTLAEKLRVDGIEAILDQWSLVPGDQLPEFMEKAVRESNFVLIICTHKYKDKSDKRIGGVGYEGDIITGEVLKESNHRKFIPILRQKSWEESAPSWLVGKIYVDLSDDPLSAKNYQQLMSTLHGILPSAPKVVERAYAIKKPISDENIAEKKKSFTVIKIIGINKEKMTMPRNDGTSGSALYRIPFDLSTSPPSEWIEIFINTWNRPPRFTTMHRPGIATIVGKTIFLDGTTIEEVEKYHKDTLILALNEANRAYVQMLIEKEQRETEGRKRLAEVEKKINEAADRLKFQ